MGGLELHSISFHVMGTNCALHVYAPTAEAAQHTLRQAVTEVQRIESRYSRYRSDSDLAGLNRVAKAGGSLEVDDETAGLLNYAFAAYQRSGGLFDITSGLLRLAWDFKSGRTPTRAALDQLLPRVGLDKVIWKPPHLAFTLPGMEIDFGGLGKEYAADRAATICQSAGVVHGLVDLGGDIRVIGPHPNGEPWRIGIRHPRRPGDFIATACLQHGALATSGDYERCIEVGGRRYSHILHPATGWPVEGLCSVTVIADECLLAGTLCTVAMLMSHQGPGWLRSLHIPYFCVDEKGACDQVLWPSLTCPTAIAA
jgi:thiamine biosynthesis lipoprotein